MHGSRRTKTFFGKERGTSISVVDLGLLVLPSDIRVRTKWTTFSIYRRTFSSLIVIAPAFAAQCVVLDATLISLGQALRRRESTGYRPRGHAHTTDRFGP